MPGFTRSFNRRPRSAITTGLKYWWPCDDANGVTIVREVMQQAHGTAATSPGPTGFAWYGGRQPVTGAQVRAVRSTSTPTALFLSNSLTIPSPNFALSCWVTQTSATVGSGGYGNVLGAFGSTNTRLQLQIKSTGFWVWNTSNSFQDPGPAGPLLGWPTHVVWQYTGTNFQLFHNLSLVTNSAGTADPSPFSSSGLAWCAGGFQASNFLNAIIRDIRIYNRSLSVSEVQQIYSEGYTPPNDFESVALAKAPASAALFRRTLSGLGTHIGGRAGTDYHTG